MSSIVSGYEYDIFISYRHNDNRSGWVSDFVTALQEELATALKEPLSIYFDTNPHDGLRETHNVDKSLQGKLKCAIFIPILSRTYCDPKSYAWSNEFIPFRDLSREDNYGLDITLGNGNVASRILPVRIHDLDAADLALFEKETNSVLRSIDFVFKSPGVNRPLTPADSRNDNLAHTYYRDQVNKVANAIKEILEAPAFTGKEPERPTTHKGRIEKKEKKTSLSGLDWLWQELNNRLVFRAAFAYLVAAIVLFQLATLIFRAMDWPEWTISAVTWILIGLFPAALLAAWFFEFSPTGVIRTASRESQSNPYSPEKKKPLTGNVIIGLLLVLLAIQFAYINSVNTGTDQNHPNERTIALLPFTNPSGNEEEDYYTVGMMQEIINQLVKIRELNVVSLTSTMAYRGSSKSVDQIAKELGVAHVLEGSVQRAGNQVKVNVRLIDARKDKNLWSESFIRDLRDIFELQATISKNIARELKTVLSIAEVENLNLVYTTSSEAYDYYLKSLYYERKDDWINGIEMCNKAIAIDPKFTLAYVLRSNWQGTHYFNKWPTWEGRDKLAKADMQKAMELNPELPEVKICQAFTLYHSELDYESAIEILSALAQQRPNDVQVYYWLGIVQRRKGDWIAAVSNLERAVNMDPRNTDFLTQTALLHFVLRNYSKVIEYANRALAIDPDVGTVGWLIHTSLLAWKGDVDLANDTITEIAGRGKLESISDSMRLEWSKHYYKREFAQLLVLNEQSKEEITEDQNYYEPRDLRFARIYYLMQNQKACRKFANSAIAILRKRLFEPEPDYRIYSALGYAYAFAGYSTEAINFATKAVEVMPVSADAFSDGLSAEQSLLEVYIITGDYNAAMDKIEYLLSIPGNISVQLLKVDPVYDKLRSLPRFNQIIGSF
jgi:TolB-like protein/Flp pilus assembly protein TadD